eukprot:g2175.t1
MTPNGHAVNKVSFFDEPLHTTYSTNEPAAANMPATTGVGGGGGSVVHSTPPAPLATQSNPAAASLNPSHTPGSKEEKLKRIMNTFAKMQHELQEERRMRKATEKLLQHGVGTDGAGSPSDSFRLAKDLATTQQDLIDKSTQLQDVSSQKAELATKLDATERARKMIEEENKRNADDLRSVSNKYASLERRFQEYTQALQRAEEENSSLNERMDALRAVNHRLERRNHSLHQNLEEQVAARSEIDAKYQRLRGVEDDSRRLHAKLRETAEKHKQQMGFMETQAAATAQQVRLLQEQCTKQAAELETLRSKNSQLSHWAQVGENAIAEVQKLTSKLGDGSESPSPSMGMSMGDMGGAGVIGMGVGQDQDQDQLSMTMGLSMSAMAPPPPPPRGVSDGVDSSGDGWAGGASASSLADQLVQAASEGDEDEFAELFDKLGEKDKSKLIQILGGAPASVQAASPTAVGAVLGAAGEAAMTRTPGTGGGGSTGALGGMRVSVPNQVADSMAGAQPSPAFSGMSSSGSSAGAGQNGVSNDSPTTAFWGEVAAGGGPAGARGGGGGGGAAGGAAGGGGGGAAGGGAADMLDVRSSLAGLDLDDLDAVVSQMAS